MRECPLCGALMTREEAEPDVGIMVDAWLCTACDHFEACSAGDDESDYMDDAARG